MPDVHALLSASSSKQWLHCPPSVRLQENFPNESSVYAEFVISIIEHMKENGCEPLAFVEERVDYSHIAPSGFGTADMPECVYVNHEVEMNAAERKLYDQLKHDLIIPLEDGDIDAANAASLSNKLLMLHLVH